DRARVVEDHAHAQHPRLLLPFRQEIRRLGILQRDAAHHAETLGITLDRLERVVVAVAGPRRRDDHRAIDARFVPHRHQPLDGERRRQLGLEPGNPLPVRRLRLPQMDLRIDDQASLGRHGLILPRSRRRRSAPAPCTIDFATFRPPAATGLNAGAALTWHRRPRLGAPRIYGRTSNRRASPGCRRRGTAAPNSDESNRSCSHFDLWRINSPCLCYRQTFFLAGIRLPRVASQTARHCINSRVLLTKREVALFRDAAAERFTRRFYPPPVWKVNAAAMFWKASKRERHESDDEHFGVGPYRALPGRSHRLAKLSRSGRRSDQHGLCRVAGRHAASPRPGADDSPYLPEAEASSASLRRRRRDERHRRSPSCRP